MKKVKRIALALVCVLVIGVLSGCGSKFDAKAYMEAMLDASYKNDPTKFVDMKIGTKEEAAALYEKGIDAEMDAFLSELSISEELEGEFREMFKNMLSQVKYTVDSAEEQDKETWVVNITYEKMLIFAPVMEEYETAITEMITDWTTAATAGEETPSEDEMMEQMIAKLKDCMENNLTGVEYAEPATTTVKVELVDNVWTPNQSDIENLEMLLFDTDEAQ